MRVKDICVTITDGSHNPPKGIEYSEYLMISSKNVFDDRITFDEPRYLDENSFLSEDKRTGIKRGDVLLTIVGTVGRSAVVTDNMPRFTLQRSVAVLRPDKEICCSRFLMYSLQAKRSFIVNSAKGVAQKGIYLGEVSNIDIRMPTISEQEKIVKHLDIINRIIVCRQEQLNALDDLIKARFVEMFGDPEINSMGYPVCRMNEIASYWNGLTYKPEDVCDDGTIVLRSSNIQNMQLDFADTVRVSCRIGEKKYVHNNDILMCSRNGSAKLVGKVALIKKTEEPMSFGAFMMIIRSDYYPYLMTFFQMPSFRAQIQTGATTTINQITGSMMDKVLVPVPDRNTVDQFAAIVAQVDKSKDAIRRSLAETQTLFDSLMQQYFG